MAHQSENTNRLEIYNQRLSLIDLGNAVKPQAGDVFLLVPPFGRTIRDVGRSPAYLGFLGQLALELGPDGLLCVLTSPQDAAETVCILERSLRFQLWVAVKLDRARSSSRGLPERHAALLVFSKYGGALRHTKTRIAYTFCPACDKTTKDYGGKKHTYHHYGTLMSDVWRDISWSGRDFPTEVAGRLADLFGLAPHRRIRILDLRSVQELKPRSSAAHLLFADPKNEEKITLAESRLVQGDCLEALARIPDNSVDFCFADPPYNLDKTYAMKRAKPQDLRPKT